MLKEKEIFICALSITFSQKRSSFPVSWNKIIIIIIIIIIANHYYYYIVFILSKYFFSTFLNS
jgi:hypothetical protein